MEVTTRVKELVAKWKSQAADLEQKAQQLDSQRDCDSTYYSMMAAQQKHKWDRLRNEAGELRTERNFLNRLAAELESVLNAEFSTPQTPSSAVSQLPNNGA